MQFGEKKVNGKRYRTPLIIRPRRAVRRNNDYMFFLNKQLKVIKKCRIFEALLKIKPMIFLTVFLVIANIFFVVFNMIATNRAGKLFMAQSIPLIDVTPIGITPKASKANGAIDTVQTNFYVVNYSGFDAYGLVVGVRYGGRKTNSVWISEWLKADKDNKLSPDKRGIISGKFFPTLPTVYNKGAFRLPVLKSGEEKEAIAQGNFVLETRIRDAGYEGFPVFVRVTWLNKTGRFFDEIFEYRLFCTEVGEGRSFNFIKQGRATECDKE